VLVTVHDREGRAMFDAIVLAGGAAARLDGADKPALLIGASSMFERVLDAVSDAGRIVVVGPQRPTHRHLIWCVEQPPGSGPLAALAAGVHQVHSEVVLVLAADLPWIGSAVPRLLAAVAEDPLSDCAVLVAAGRRNYLAAAWRRTGLLRALASIPDVHGGAMRQLYAAARTIDVNDDDGAGRDCDTWTDIQQARERAETTEETS
jgi:molybdopterin-guanine dinucleotide biosynthesis protein A